jgi:serine/threonine-protein kinase
MGSDPQPSKRPPLTSERWQQICAVLDRVLDAQPSQQRAVFDASCRAEGISAEDAARFLSAIEGDQEFLKGLPAALVTAALGPISTHPPLAPGARYGAYEVLGVIGAGGMGEVYRARDSKLHRTVALKVLPDRFAVDPDRLARFKREARLLASLNHPNIAAIYGFEEGESPSRTGEALRALALELVEGPTLAERLMRGALPLDETLAIARQILDALESSHDAGIVHRDLKPSNIKVRRSNDHDDVMVKVLDFGVAKALSPIEIASDVVAEPSPTNDAAAVTNVGVLIGSAPYMAPEQIKGKPIDQRADIWAFGCVLYEMLTGTRAFVGEGTAETLGLIVATEPDWTKLPASTPAPLRRLLRRCLEKDRKRRLAHVADARLDVDEAQVQQPTSSPTPITYGFSRIAWLAAAMGIVLAAGAAIIGWSVARRAPTGPAIVTRLTMPLPSGIDAPAVSPDGSQIAFLIRNPTRHIVLRRLDEVDGKPIAGTEDATMPTFSPDGKWIAYRTTVQMEGANVSRLKKIPVTGGAAVTLVDSVVPNGGGLTWGEDDYIYYVDDGLSRVRSTGGHAEQIISRDEQKGELGFLAPQLLPGGRWLLFTVGLAPTAANPRASMAVAAVNVRTGERRTAMPSGGPAVYAQSGGVPSSGHLVYGQDGSLFAAPFDAERVAVRDGPVRVVEPSRGAALAGFLGLSKTGTLAYAVTDTGTVVAELAWVDRDGSEKPIPDLPARPYTAPRLSPDGRRAVLTVIRAGQAAGPVLSDIWTYDFVQRRLTTVTFDGRTVDRSAVWTPDGKRLIYTFRTESGGAELRSASADGSDVPGPLTNAPGALEGLGVGVPLPSSISPDGKYLIGTVAGAGRPGIFEALLDGAVRFQALLDRRMIEGDPHFSPNGRWIAYQSNRSGRAEIWVAPHPNPKGRWQQVSTDGGTAPRWAASGRELFYRNGTKMIAVYVDAGATFHAGTPKVLFEGRYDDYDVAPDGKQFLMIKSAGGGTGATDPQSRRARELHIVVNWFHELQRLVPLEK